MRISKLALCASSSLLALNVAAYAAEQQAAEPAVEEVIVTGTRIQLSGYEQPTPVTVVGTAQIENAAAQNIADFVSQMPAITGSASPQSSNAGISSHAAGLSTLSLRGLGGSRTLVLLDGQRSVGSTTAGLVDVNDIPQDLVSRVDVVTGGASAAYGSDALSGVVNFILDKTYVGTKGELSGSITTYGDDPQWRIRLSHGSTFGGDKGHLIVSGEMSVRYGIFGVPREWNNQGAFILSNPTYSATNGQPFLLNVRGAALWQATKGGVITSAGPLKGVYFGEAGTPKQMKFDGVVGGPVSVTSDFRALQVNDNNSLDPFGASQRLFTRASYQFTDHINGFVQLSWSHTHAVGWDILNFRVANLNVKADNAFIPTSVAATIAANGITQFTMGSMFADLGVLGNDNDRTTNRYVFGFNGDFDALDTNWNWNTYFQKGVSRTAARATNILRSNDRLPLAIDAVRNPATGAIVCRSTLANPTNGCVPYNLFGIGVNSEESVDYLSGGRSRPRTGFPLLHESFYQDVFSADIQGTPFSSWAGPVAIGMGVEHRRERAGGDADPTSGTWLAGNYVPVIGKYNVTEGFLETVIPLARDQVWARSLDLNAAVRATSYSVSGFVATWKVGATWDIIPDLRIRVTRSRDIRAPNHSELYGAGAGGTSNLFDRFHLTNNVANNVQSQGLVTGNLLLEPEKADTTGVGVVVQPQFIPGFSASVDYYNINIKDVIGTIGGQNVIDYCFNGLKQFCAAMTPDLSQLTATPAVIIVRTQPFNFASRLARGYDIEASYGTNLDAINPDWQGSAELRFLATHFMKDIQDNKLAPPIDTVGGSTIPRWRFNISANYTRDPLSMTLSARGVSAGVYNTTYIQCASGCPASTIDNQTINDNFVPSAWFFDAAMNYTFRFGDEENQTLQAFLNIQNLLNTDPPIISQGPGSIPNALSMSNPVLHDVLGRVFRAGIRFRM